MPFNGNSFNGDSSRGDACSASAALGADQPDANWRLEPLDNARKMTPAAGALKRILQRHEVRKLMDDFVRHDAAAVAAQQRYKLWSKLAIWTRLGAIAVGALFLLPALAASRPGDPVYQVAIGLQYGCLALAFMFTALVTYRKLFSRWMTARARAEAARHALFNFVVEAQEASEKGEMPALPLQLEYFRRYQLDVQIRYYSGRGQQHASAAGATVQAMRLLQLLSACAAVPVVLVVLHWFGFALIFDELWGKGFLVFGVIASGLFASLLAVSQMNLDERNADRYSVTHQNLEFLRKAQLDQARDAAARGDKATVLDFVHAAHRLISSEHQEWLVLKECVHRPEQTAQFILQPTQIGLPKG
jgi:hypothetical protein